MDNKNSNDDVNNKESEKLKLEEMKDVSDIPANRATPLWVSLSESKNIINDKLKNTKYESVYHAHFDMTLDMMCISFGNGYLIMVNDYFAKILEYEKEELEGKPVLDFIHPDDIESTINAQANVIDNSKLSFFENRWRKKNGEYIHLEWSSNGSDEIYYSVARVRGEINEYLSRVTHELRTPLNSIIGFTELLEMSDNLSSSEKKHVDHISKSSKHLLSLVNDIINLSKTDNKGYQLEFVNLRQFIEDHLENYKPVINEKHLTINFHYSYFDNKVAVASGRLRQILANIINNAIKFSNNLGKLSVYSELEDDNIVINIEDEGCGIPDSFKQYLFVPFKRANKKIEGTGLGLSITKKLIELFNGKINVESKEGKGTNVKIKLPIHGNINRVFDEKLKVIGYYEKEKISVLYVEDNLSNIEIVKLYLNKAYPNAEFNFATTAEEGFKFIECKVPDILFLDYHLPDIDGDELYSKIKKNPKFKKIKNVIMISADSSKIKMDKIKKLGIETYLVKPIFFNDFKIALDNSLI